MAPSQTFGSVDPEKILATAVTDHKAGRLEDARRGYRTVLALRPDDAKASHLLGLAEMGLGQIDAGLESFSRAVACEPNNPTFHVARAIALNSKGLIEDAAAACRRALILKPDYFDAFGCLFDLLAQLARREVANGLSAQRTSAAQPAPAGAPLISVVVCSIDDDKRRRIRAHYESLLAGWRHEIIQIADAKSLCEGYNRSFAQSAGDVLIFSHDDIEIVSPDFPARLLRHLATNDVVGIAGTTLLDDVLWIKSGWPHIHGLVVHRSPEAPNFRFECFGLRPKQAGIQAIDGVLIAATRKVCEAVSFDQETFDGFHFYDLDFSYRAFRAGYKLTVAYDVMLIHDSGGVTDATWEQYAPRFARKYQGQIPFSNRPRDLRLAVAALTHKAEILDLHGRLLGTLDELDT